jgi:hypothetical protein
MPRSINELTAGSGVGGGDAGVGGSESVAFIARTSLRAISTT